MSDEFSMVSRRLELPAALGAALLAAAERAARAAAGKGQRRPRPRGLTLQPGAQTPLWNELVRQVTPLLAPRGGKARLARYLGLPRQRLQDCLKSKSACLDAERTLLLLSWLAAHHQTPSEKPARAGRVAS
ncbi:MAG: hypothetical protein HY302_06180 [Opitutae bacterium]|nr:hypothetical protein [Opitutae bacterium]